jgi:hypothetical protein
MKICSIATCERPSRARGWCSNHHQRWRLTGDPETPHRQGESARARAAALPPVAERFAARVDRNGPTPEHRPGLGPCWVWTGPLDDKGYGRFYDGSRTRKAHTYAFELASGPMPEGLEPDHLCRNRACVNAERHLEAVTHRENSQRAAYFKELCASGHPLPEPAANGRRVCRPCANERNKAYKARLREARDLYDAVTGGAS